MKIKGCIKNIVKLIFEKVCAKNQVEKNYLMAEFLFKIKDRSDIVLAEYDS